MRCEWYFRNEPSEIFSEIPGFKLKSPWKSPEGHQWVENWKQGELFSFLTDKHQGYNLFKKE